MEGLEEKLARGVACKIEGRYDEAASEIQAVLEQQSDNAEAHHQLGLVYGFIGLFDESIHHLEQGTHLDPENVLARNDLALTYTMLGRYEEAKAEFAGVLERDRQNDVALRNLNYLP